MTSMLIKGARVVCPASDLDDIVAITIEDGRITHIGDERAADHVVDADGQLLLPGGVCLDTQLSDPGREDNETLAQTLAAAARGGITTVLGHAPGPPVPADGPGVRELLSRARDLPGATLRIAGHATAQGRGANLSDMGEMHAAGASAVTDLSASRIKRAILRPAMEYAASFNLLFVTSPLDAAMAGAGVCTEGAVSTALGLPASGAEAEVIGAVTALECARRARVRLHLAGLSTRAALERVLAAQDQGVAVTASCPIAHLLLDESEHLRRRFDPALRLLPPLRAADDRAALVGAVEDGRLSVSTQHRAHGPTDKDVEFEQAAPGGPALGATYPLLVDEVGPRAAARAFSLHPAQTLGETERGRIAEGAVADLVLFASSDAGPAAALEGRHGARSPVGRRSAHHRVMACFVDGRPVELAPPLFTNR